MTIGPNSNEIKTTNIGVAAHITAASIGSPRYDERITTEFRSSIANAFEFYYNNEEGIVGFKELPNGSMFVFDRVE